MIGYPYNLPEDHPDRRMELDYLQEFEYCRCQRCNMEYDLRDMACDGLCEGCAEDEDREL